MTDAQSPIQLGSLDRLLEGFDLRRYDPYVDAMRTLLVPSLENRIYSVLREFVYKEDSRLTARYPCLKKWTETVEGWREPLNAFHGQYGDANLSKEILKRLVKDGLVACFVNSIVLNNRLNKINRDLNSLGIERNWLSYFNVWNFISEKDYWREGGYPAALPPSTLRVSTVNDDDVFSDTDFENRPRARDPRRRKRALKRPASFDDSFDSDAEDETEGPRWSFEADEDHRSPSCSDPDIFHKTAGLSTSDRDRCERFSSSTRRSENSKSDSRSETLKLHLREIRSAEIDGSNASKSTISRRTTSRLSLPCKGEDLISRIVEVDSSLSRLSEASRRKFESELNDVSSRLNDVLGGLTARSIGRLCLFCELRRIYVGFELKPRYSGGGRTCLFAGRVSILRNPRKLNGRSEIRGDRSHCGSRSSTNAGIRAEEIDRNDVTTIRDGCSCANAREAISTSSSTSESLSSGTSVEKIVLKLEVSPFGNFKNDASLRSMMGEPSSATSTGEGTGGNCSCSVFMQNQPTRSSCKGVNVDSTSTPSAVSLESNATEIVSSAEANLAARNEKTVCVGEKCLVAKSDEFVDSESRRNAIPDSLLCEPMESSGSRRSHDAPGSTLLITRNEENPPPAIAENEETFAMRAGSMKTSSRISHLESEPLKLEDSGKSGARERVGEDSERPAKSINGAARSGRRSDSRDASILAMRRIDARTPLEKINSLELEDRRDSEVSCRRTGGCCGRSAKSMESRSRRDANKDPKKFGKSSNSRDTTMSSSIEIGSPIGDHSCDAGRPPWLGAKIVGRDPREETPFTRRNYRVTESGEKFAKSTKLLDSFHSPKRGATATKRTPNIIHAFCGSFSNGTLARIRRLIGMKLRKKLFKTESDKSTATDASKTFLLNDNFHPSASGGRIDRARAKCNGCDDVFIATSSICTDSTATRNLSTLSGDRRRKRLPDLYYSDAEGYKRQRGGGCEDVSAFPDHRGDDARRNRVLREAGLESRRKSTRDGTKEGRLGWRSDSSDEEDSYRCEYCPREFRCDSNRFSSTRRSEYDEDFATLHAFTSLSSSGCSVRGPSRCRPRDPDWRGTSTELTESGSTKCDLVEDDAWRRCATNFDRAEEPGRRRRLYRTTNHVYWNKENFQPSALSREEFAKTSNQLCASECHTSRVTGSRGSGDPEYNYRLSLLERDRCMKSNSAVLSSSSGRGGGVDDLEENFGSTLTRYVDLCESVKYSWRKRLRLDDIYEVSRTSIPDDKEICKLRCLYSKF